MDTSLSKLWEMVKDREAWHAAVYVDRESDRRKESDMSDKLNNKEMTLVTPSW